MQKLEEDLKNIVVEETDPTVPEWAKQPNKPRYTAAEVGALSSTETVRQLALKQDKSNLVTAINDTSVDSTYPSTRAVYEYVGTKIADLVGSAPETLNTIEEIAEALAENQDVVDALNAAIANKQDKLNLVTTISDSSTDAQFPSARAVANFAVGRKGTGTRAEKFNNSNNIASGTDSHAEGERTTASATSAHAEGTGTTASGYASHTEGESTVARTTGSHAEGKGTEAGQANGQSYTHAEGVSSRAYGRGSHAEGENTLAQGSYSHAEGGGTQATNDYSHAEGCNAAGSNQNTTASGYGSHAEGRSTQATKEGSHSEGVLTQAKGPAAHTEGRETIAGNADNHTGAHAEGFKSQALNASAHAEGYNTRATGDSSHAEGNATQATGIASHAEGKETEASGNYSHAEGCKDGNIATTASGEASHAEGIGTWAIGRGSHSEGKGTSASKQAAHAEGEGTTASGTSSHSEGYFTQASGTYSHVEGYASLAEGYSSHAEGYSSHAEGDSSHAEGNYTIASGECSHVQGKYNIEDNENKYAHIVGNGDYTKRSNAHTLDWNGNAWFAGNLYVGGQNQDEAMLIEPLEWIPGESGFIFSEENLILDNSWEGTSYSFTTPLNLIDGQYRVYINKELVYEGKSIDEGNGRFMLRFNFSTGEVSIYNSIIEFYHWGLAGEKFSLQIELQATKTLNERYIPNNIPKITTASIGQILEVESIDENGKPTKWKAVDKGQNSVYTLEIAEIATGSFTYIGESNFEKLLRACQNNQTIIIVKDGFKQYGFQCATVSDDYISLSKVIFNYDIGGTFYGESFECFSNSIEYCSKHM